MKTILKAMDKFRQDCPIIHQETEGYKYTYANLPTIFDKINPLLKKHGLGFIQPLSRDTIKTIVFHIESGEQIESEIELKHGVKLAGMNDFQVIGSQITYLRRYSLSSLLGLICCGRAVKIFMVIFSEISLLRRKFLLSSL